MFEWRQWNDTLIEKPSPQAISYNFNWNLKTKSKTMSCLDSYWNKPYGTFVWCVEALIDLFSETNQHSLINNSKRISTNQLANTIGLFINCLLVKETSLNWVLANKIILSFWRLINLICYFHCLSICFLLFFLKMSVDVRWFP